MNEPHLATENDIEQFIQQANASVLSKENLSGAILWLFKYKDTMVEVSLCEFMKAKFVSYSAQLFDVPLVNKERSYERLLLENGQGPGLYFGISQLSDNVLLLMNSQFAIELSFQKFDAMLEMMRQAARVIMSDPEDFKQNFFS